MLDSFEDEVGFISCDAHNGEQKDDLQISVDDEENADVLIDNIKVDWAENHRQPAANVDGRKKYLKFGEAFEVVNIHEGVVGKF